jgi:hypothetical protein
VFLGTGHDDKMDLVVWRVDGHLVLAEVDRRVQLRRQWRTAVGLAGRGRYSDGALTAQLRSDDYDAGLPHCVERIAASLNPLEEVSQYQ